MRTRLSATLVLVGLAIPVVDCVSLKRTPDARLFVLESLVEPRPVPPGEAPTAVIGVEAARLPGHLQRPQIVTWTARNELAIDEFVRWGEPLRDGLTRTLQEDLAGLLPEYRIIRRPWSGDTTTRCRVRVSLRVFGLQRDGMVRLDGRWALLPDRGGLALAQQPVSLQRGPVSSVGGAPPATGVDLMSELVADLSRQIAGAIRALPPEQKPVEIEEERVTSEEIEDRSDREP
ncbi:MAG: PqiC family protein [Acidobacteriota bacterium]|jgi:uncharacterized lipoprotein YmbA